MKKLLIIFWTYIHIIVIHPNHILAQEQISATPTIIMSPTLNLSATATVTMTQTPTPTLLTTHTPTISQTPSLTPTNLPSLTPTAIQHNLPLKPYLTEIMACPQNSVEWIEIYNPNHQKLSLNHYYLKDEKKIIYQFENEIIHNTNFIAVDLSNKLNNTGDRIDLFNNKNELIDTFQYTKCTPGESFVLMENKWTNSSIQTKAAPNITPTITQTPTSITPTDYHKQNTPSPQLSDSPIFVTKQHKPTKTILPTMSSIYKQPTMGIFLNPKIDDNKIFTDENKIQSTESSYLSNEKNSIMRFIAGGAIFILIVIVNFYDRLV